jgi:hypothetical protein
VDLQNKIKVEGKIIFDPIDVTKKHQKQSSWKKVAMVHIGSDISEYYAWFIRKRYNINLTPPLRKAHITFINDRASEMNGKWKEVKKKWDGKKITITLSVDPRTDSDEPNSDAHWWLNVPEEDREELHDIRAELGLGRPFYGLHMSVGRAVNMVDDDKFIPGVKKAKEMNVEQSKYIHRLIKKGIIR